MENSIDHIITRILSGNSSSEDFLSLSEWLNADEKNKKEFRLLKSYWDAEVSFSHSLMPNVSLDNLRKKIDDQSRQKRLRLIRFIATPIAAAIAFLVLFFATTHLNTREGKVQQFYTYITDKNKSHFTLDDGTKIILNRNSRFTYSDAYGTDQRKVNLEGEAYFEVAKDAKKPFVVQAGEIDVEVLGTCFDLDSYSSGELVETALLNGSVKISGKALKDPVYLKPNELFRYRKSDQIASVEEAKVGLYADWIKDRLVFDNDCLADILISMEGRYNMDIECPKQFAASTHLSFTIRQESIEEVMEAMSLIAPIRYEMKNGKVYIIPK